MLDLQQSLFATQLANVVDHRLATSKCYTIRSFTLGNSDHFSESFSKSLFKLSHSNNCLKIVNNLELFRNI